MRRWVIVLFALVSVGCVSSSAHAAASPARTDIHISFQAICSAASSLRSDRSYLADNKNKAAWASRAPGTLSTMDQVLGGFSGGTKSGLAAARNGFADAARNQGPKMHPEYVNGLRDIDSFAGALLNAAKSYGRDCDESAPWTRSSR